jgi:serine/threonine protein kinase
MTCPSCNSPLEPNARFCGVCGYRLAPNRPPPPASGVAPRNAARPPQPLAQPDVNAGTAGKAGPPPSVHGQKRPAGKSRTKPADDIYIDQALNNRFRVESKIGEGGFGAVYRGVQLATGRKVALKLLHPEMTKDENLVARFRREGMVLCNLRDAHTITTYDFDQTPDGTLYIAMELLEGKSLHQLFHEEAPLEWKRVFKILTEMCSSLAEAHAQGIVHRDLKPENIYLETRAGNPEFVKILDFGIAKVMRGDSIDPQSPQLTATGQTLGTLEYMSPEQLMGKALDGRSDVYALGVLAYEMTTGRLPFPDAKGPAGLITAQLKQTPMPPSQANPNANLPRSADRAILRCLEKDKNNRFPDVTALAAALQDAVTGQSELRAASRSQPERADRPERIEPSAPPSAISQPQRAPAMPPSMAMPSGPSDMPQAGMPQHPLQPPAMQPLAMQAPAMPMYGAPHDPRAVGQGPPGEPASRLAPMGAYATPGTPMPPGVAPPAGSPLFGPPPMPLTPFPQQQRAPTTSPMASYPQMQYPASSRRFVWWVIALLAVGAGVGTAMALIFS